MRGIFWNSRGLSDLAKTKFLTDTVKEKKLDFIALLETGKKDFSIMHAVVRIFQTRVCQLLWVHLKDMKLND